MEQTVEFCSVRIGDVLREQGCVTEEQIAAALDYQREHRGVRLGQVLIDQKVITERQMLTALGICMGLPLKELAQMTVDLGAASMVPKELALRYQMLPVQAADGILTILTNDPLNFYGLEDIRQITGMDLELYLCESGPLSRGIRYYYSEIEARKAADQSGAAGAGNRTAAESQERPGNGVGHGKQEGPGNWDGCGKQERLGNWDGHREQETSGNRIDLRNPEGSGSQGGRKTPKLAGDWAEAGSTADKDNPDETEGDARAYVSGSEVWKWQSAALRRGIHDCEELGESAENIVSLLDQLIRRAYWNDASDIHIEPYEDRTMIRMRIDGVMTEFAALHKQVHRPLVARVKILGDMDIAECRLPQDGHFRMMIDGEPVNVRVSVIPTVYGEKAVIRLLAGNHPIDFEDTFGMSRKDYEKLRQMLDAPNGLIYLTGPTGSGKTTTLYLVLRELSRRPVNICTIEDPVEKNIPGISQCQVNHQKGLTFESGLRALLRQDPDIIMIGETRDKETAAISVRAAITGHLVFSTLHTNDAASSIIRLEDMGVEPYLAANSLVGVVAQRLLRKLCPECAETVDAEEMDWKLLGRKIAKIRVPKGCPSCNYTGYRGRVAIHEILVVDPAIRRMITERVPVETIREYARRNLEMRTLKECAVCLVEQGITSAEELKKAAYYSETD